MTNPDDETTEPLEPDQEPTEEEKRNQALARVLHQTALVFGYNELAKQVKLLGEKLYFRLAMQTAKEHLEELGGHIEITEDVVVAKLPGGPAFIKFYASDIELMREAVKKWDLEHNPDMHPAVAASPEQACAEKPCIWCKGTKFTEAGVLCRSCEGSGLARGTSSCAHRSPACDECVAHDTLCAMSS